MNIQQEPKENRLIAEFMDIKWDKLTMPNSPHVFYQWECEVSNPLYNKVHGQEYLQFHTSWDWLMPVVEKIESLHNGHFSFFIVQSECDIATASPYKENGEDWYAPCFAQKKGDKLLSTWQAVVEFIQWYNNQNFNQ